MLRLCHILPCQLCPAEQICKSDSEDDRVKRIRGIRAREFQRDTSRLFPAWYSPDGIELSVTEANVLEDAYLRARRLRARDPKIQPCEAFVKTKRTPTKSLLSPPKPKIEAQKSINPDTKDEEGYRLLEELTLLFTKIQDHARELTAFARIGKWAKVSKDIRKKLVDEIQALRKQVKSLSIDNKTLLDVIDDEEEYVSRFLYHPDDPDMVPCAPPKGKRNSKLAMGYERWSGKAEVSLMRKLQRYLPAGARIGLPRRSENETEEAWAKRVLEAVATQQADHYKVKNTLK